MRRRRLRPLPIALLLAVLAAVYTGYWFVLAHLVEGGIDDWMRQQRAIGGEVETAGLAVGGYPLAVRTELDNFTLRHPDGVALRGAQLIAKARPWSPNVIDIRLDGGALLTLPVRVGHVPVMVTAQEGSGALRFTLGGELADARLSLNDIAIEGTPSGRVTAGAAEVTAAQPGPDPESTLRVAGEARHLTVERVPLPQLGPVIDSAAVALSLTGPVPRAPHAADLSAWRDAGGTLRIERLALAWGPLHIEATGTLVLDQALQPRGRLDAEVRGHAQVVQALAAAGAIRPTEAGLVTMALNMMAGPPGPDGLTTLRAPLVIENGVVSLAGFPLGPMPRIVWGG